MCWPGRMPGKGQWRGELAAQPEGGDWPPTTSPSGRPVQLAEDLPPAVLAPMLGLHAATAEHWRRRAATDCTAYLEARMSTRDGGPPVLAVVTHKAAPPTIE